MVGHKNIVEYVDHIIRRSRSGVYEYSLLTAYYKNSVLQLMNDRIMGGRCLSANEILAIFCDMCEAVARLHHSQTPVIHRDLKIENILIDDRRRGAPAVYVLCDFGSATTKVLSTETHSMQFVEEEIQRYTTLSYRAPEMVDLYSGRPIGTKIDIWALGVMLYKMCYFMLPFGESALAIQNCAYSFPSEPQYPDELRAIMKVLLENDIDKRPDIYQTAALAFEARSMRSPVGNLNKVRAIPLSEALASLRGEPVGEGGARHAVASQAAPFAKPEASLIKTEQVPSLTANQGAVMTSVNPRLRPKPSSSAARFPAVGSAVGLVPSSSQVAQTNVLRHQSSVSNPDIGSTSISAMDTMSKSDQSGSLTVAAGIREHLDLGFTDLEAHASRSEEASRAERRFDGADLCYEGSVARPPSRDHPSIHASAPQLFDVTGDHRQVGEPEGGGAISGTLRSSAFKPYSATSAKGSVSARGVTGEDEADSGSASERVLFDFESNAASWNPFADAPYEEHRGKAQSKRTTMDDRSFGKCFDELRRSNRRGSVSSTANVKSSESLVMTIDESDPFGAAPFTPFSLRTRGISQDVSGTESAATNRVCSVKHHTSGDDVDSIGSTSDLRLPADVGSGGEEESECDEVRMESRRRFSYEHFDGVGDNASSESRDPPDDFTSEDDDLTKGRDHERCARQCHIVVIAVELMNGMHRVFLELENFRFFKCLPPFEDATERPLLDDDELDAVRRSLNDVPISTSSSGLPLLECSSAHNSSPSADVTPPPPLPSKYIVRDEMTEWIHAKGDSCVTLSSYGQERIRVNEIPPAHHETNPFATKSFEIFPQQPFVAHSLHQVQPNAVSSSRGIGESDPVAPGPAGIYKSASTLPSSGVPHSECTSELAINAAASDRADALPRQPKRLNVLVGEEGDGLNAAQRPPQSAPATVGQDANRTRQSRGMTSSGGAFEAITAFISPREKPRAKFISAKRISLSSSASSDESPQTDDSGAEMFSCNTSGAHGKSLVSGHQRKKSGGATHSLHYRGSSSSVVEQSNSATVKLSPLLKKCSGKRYGSSLSKRGSQGTLDASSFVNSTFQAEDWEAKATTVHSPSPRHSLTQTS
ncbi:unnamed protein product [Toxocara canis]|uniref:non-specific serine/threonine protein kinase n=1 Tax=Toxocara canis TaxID=6265 RepID=A0A3P7GUB6_TOXCA|nr:unnamed protein product [Toxocara canis]